MLRIDPVFEDLWGREELYLGMGTCKHAACFPIICGDAPMPVYRNGPCHRLAIIEFRCEVDHSLLFHDRLRRDDTYQTLCDSPMQIDGHKFLIQDELRHGDRHWERLEYERHDP